MKITAAILEKTNSPLAIYDDIEVPKLSQGQILVKIFYSGVCHSQLMEARGKRGEDHYLPHMLGHEGVGEVIDIGSCVSKFSVGEKVVLGWIKGEGIDSGGCTYKQENRTINAGSVTTFSNYAVISENRLVSLPRGIDEKVAVLLGCALPTGAGIILNQVKPHSGSNIAVFGLGGIGLSALLAINHFTPQCVVAIDIEPEKLALAKAFGATHCYLATEEGINAFHQDFPLGVEYVVEAAGKVSTIEIAFEMTKRGGGKCVFASHPAHGDKISIDPFELICGKQLMGSWGGASKPDLDIPIIVDIINKYQLPIEKLLSKAYSLQQINEALNDLEQRKITRALIEM